jgi:5'-nucleotidase
MYYRQLPSRADRGSILKPDETLVRPHPGGTAQVKRRAGNVAWRPLFVSCLTLLTATAAGFTLASPSAAAAPSKNVLTVLVTNDDGVSAPGINAVVQGLRALPKTQVTVVAPLTNQSGTGGKTTPGHLTVTKATTASGYPARAVAGYPADTVIWAIKQHGISFRPDLVVSGINFGQNIGPLANLSGTVGAARAAVKLGIPALAASQGIDNGLSPNFSQGVAQVLRWVRAHRAELLSRHFKKPPQGNLNVPTCAPGPVRGPIAAPAATSLNGITITTVNCTSTSTAYTNDAEAFVLGYAVIAPLSSPS